MGETTTHRRLKRLAAGVLFGDGCQAVATEVRCPIGRYRVDVAGYLDPLPARDRHRRIEAVASATSVVLRRARGRARTAFLECKQARSDYLRDSRELDDLVGERDRLERERVRIEQEWIRSEEPHLRRSEGYLFPELESWDFGRSRNGAYKQLVRRLDRLEAKIHGETKFGRIARYRLADALYIVAPRGLIRAEEVAPGWGLLEVEPDALESSDAPGASVASVTRRAPVLGAPAHRHDRLLRNIAVAACRDAFRTSGDRDGEAD